MAKRRTLKAHWLQEKQRADKLEKENKRLKGDVWYYKQCASAMDNIQRIGMHHEFHKQFFESVDERTRITAMLHDMINSEDGYKVFRQAMIGEDKQVATHFGGSHKVIVSDYNIYICIPRIEKINIS